MSSGRKSTYSLVLTAKEKGLTGVVSKTTGSLKLFHHQVGLAQKEARALEGGLGRLTGKFAALAGGVSGVAFAKSVWDAALSMDNLNKSFRSVYGDSTAAGEALEYVGGVADKLGLDFETTANGFKSLAAASKGTALEGKATRDIFLGISKASAALGLSADQTHGALNAIQQMISKGNVQAEELRGQLGERLPGAFQLAAKAMGVSTQQLDKMLKQGKVATTDLLPKLAQALEDTYGEAAINAGDSAQAAVNRLNTAWFKLRVGIADAGFLDLATGKIKELTASLQDPTTQKNLHDLTKRFVEVTEKVADFVKAHGETIAKFGVLTLALSSLSKTVHLFIGTWKGLNVAFLGLTGLNIIPWLKTLETSLIAGQGAAMALQGALLRLMLYAGSFIAGFKIGSHLYQQFEPAHRELNELQLELAKTEASLRKYAGFQPQSGKSLFMKPKKELEEYKEALIGAYKHQNAIVQGLQIAASKKNSFGMMTKGAKQASVELVAARVKLEDLESAMDEYRSVADGSYKKIADAAASSAGKQQQATGAALEDMKREWKKYADRVKSLQDQIASRELSLSEKLRSMSRSTMSQGAAWQDRKKEADEYAAAAEKAAKAGDYDQAVKMADKAMAAYEDLNREVVENEQVIVSAANAQKTAMSGVESMGKLATEALKAQEEAASSVADELNGKSGWIFGEAFTEVGKESQRLSELVKEYGSDWGAVWENMEKEGLAATSKVQDKVRELKSDLQQLQSGKWVFDIVQRSSGGTVEKLARGGHLAGYGGGDRVPALLEPGEFVIRKEAVGRYGSGYLHALNNMSLNSTEMLLGKVSKAVAGADRVQRLQSGGQVQQGAAGGNTINVTLNYSGSGASPRQDAKGMVRVLKRELDELEWGRS